MVGRRKNRRRAAIINKPAVATVDPHPSSAQDADIVCPATENESKPERCIRGEYRKYPGPELADGRLAGVSKIKVATMAPLPVNRAFSLRRFVRECLRSSLKYGNQGASIAKRIRGVALTMFRSW